MEEPNQGIGGNRLPALATTAEAAALDIIRTETVLSRLPVHNLAKKGSINISILKKTDAGEIELMWRVSPSRDYGEPRQLAYKLDTIVINQRIDEAGRPLPKMLRLGSLNGICEELGLAPDHGTSAKNIKNAFLQNALTGITAKFSYRANDNSERRLEAAFTRYSVIFTGEKLPDGRKADAVYVIFNEPFWEVLNNAPVRPLDRAYMKQLPPAAQRFYEIVSRKIFAALKNNYPRAKISYSEYCTFSAQLRHLERQRVQDQMAKVFRPHKASGYITEVRYEPTIDAENKPDWILYLTPGPKAFAEFALAHGRKVPKHIERALAEAGEGTVHHERANAESRSDVQTARTPPPVDSALLAEFIRAGRDIAEDVARTLIANRKPGQDFVAQLEMADEDIEKSKDTQHPIIKPAAYRVSLVRRNIQIPDNFETSAKRKARQEKERLDREQRIAEDARVDMQSEYEAYCDGEVDQYIAANLTALDALKNAKLQEGRGRSSFMTETMAQLEARWQIRKQLPLLTFEEFQERKDHTGTFSVKPVPVAPAAESAAGSPTPLMVDVVAAEKLSVQSDVLSQEPESPIASSEAPVEIVPSASEPKSFVPEPLMFDLMTDVVTPPDAIDSGEGMA